MTNYHLIIGSQNLSSWSLRAWLAMQGFGLPFEKTVIALDRPETRAEILKHAPHGRVPILHDGDQVIWDSLAIIEYLADRHPDLAIWPRPPAARAHARAISAEMHAGFAAMRNEVPFDFCGRYTSPELSAEAAQDIARIIEIWQDARRRFGDGGDFLFGDFSAADAFYAPVASRFQSYALRLPKIADDYVQAVLSLPALEQWESDARRELSSA